MITSALKKCSVVLYDIQPNNSEDSQLPLVTKRTSVLKTVDGRVIPIYSYLWSGLKRKLQNFTEKEETDEPPGKKNIVKIISDSEEETDEPPEKKKIVKMISDSEETDEPPSKKKIAKIISESDEETDEPPTKKKIAKIISDSEKETDEPPEKKKIFNIISGSEKTDEPQEKKRINEIVSDSEEETDEPPSKKKIAKIISDSEEEADEPPAKKKTVNIISDLEEEADEPPAKKKTVKMISDSEEEADEPPAKKKTVKMISDSEKEADEAPAKKKTVNIISNSEEESHEASEDSDYEDETENESDSDADEDYKKTKFRGVKNEKKVNKKVKEVKKSDENFKKEKKLNKYIPQIKEKSNVASEDSYSEEETESESETDSDEDYKVESDDSDDSDYEPNYYKKKVNKKVKEAKKSDKNFRKKKKLNKYVPQIKKKSNDASEDSQSEEEIENESDTDTDEKEEKSPYELMIEKKRMERLALLESLKMDEVKSDFSAVVNSLKKTSSLKKNREKPHDSSKRNISHSAVRRSSKRSDNISVDLSKDKVFHQVVENAVAEIRPSIPSELSFSKALSSEELYETYVKDINIEDQKHSETNYVSYNRSVLQNLNLNNDMVVACRSITALSWYPSANDLILAAGSGYGHINIWNAASESDPHVFRIQYDGITNALFNPFNAVELVTSSCEGTLRCGDMVKQVFNEVYNTEANCIHFDILSSNTYLVAVKKTLKNGHVALIDKRSSEPCTEIFRCRDYSFKSVNIHPVNRNMFVTAGNLGSVFIWDLRKLERDPVARAIHHKQSINSAFFSSVTGNSILTTSIDDTICIFDSTNLTTEEIKVTKQMKHKNNIMKATWLPNSDEIFVVGNLTDSPKIIPLYDKDMKIYHQLQHENLTRTGLNIFHPLKSAFAGSNDNGKVFVFT